MGNEANERDDKRTTELPEFDVRRDESGRWHGRHKSSGQPIEADTFERLELCACAVRIAVGLRRAIP
jgi:hypothetical protein